MFTFEGFKFILAICLFKKYLHTKQLMVLTVLLFYHFTDNVLKTIANLRVCQNLQQQRHKTKIIRSSRRISNLTSQAPFFLPPVCFSGISMIHLIMSVGFSVDFSAHICAAYLMSDARTRAERAEYAIVHASGPIFNGGMSSLVGVSMLLMSESYIFTTFFKIMSMVITAGAVHAVFFMPILLSYIGPENTTEHDTVPDGHTHSVLKKTETVVSNGIYSGSKLVGKENTKDRNSHKTVLELMKEDDSATEQGAQVKCSVSYSKRKDHIPSENLPAGVESLDVPGNTDGAFLSLFDNLHTDEVDKSDQQPNSITPIESVGTNLSTGRQAFVRQVQEQEAATKPINKLANGST